MLSISFKREQWVLYKKGYGLTNFSISIFLKSYKILIILKSNLIVNKKFEAMFNPGFRAETESKKKIFNLKFNYKTKNLNKKKKVHSKFFKNLTSAGVQNFGKSLTKFRFFKWVFNIFK